MMHFSYEASTGHFNIGEGVETSVEVKIRKTENLKTCSLFGDKRYLFFFNVALQSVPLHRVWHCFVTQDDIVNADGRIIPFNFFFLIGIADCFYNRERLYWNIVLRNP